MTDIHIAPTEIEIAEAMDSRKMQPGHVRDVIRRLAFQRDSLLRQLDHLQQKVDHGCANFYCKECDDG